MARMLRSTLSDGVYHVTCRGATGVHVFLDDLDRLRFLELLAEVVRREDWDVHALCLMGTHYHLIVETTQPSLSTGRSA